MLTRVIINPFYMMRSESTSEEDRSNPLGDVFFGTPGTGRQDIRHQEQEDQMLKRLTFNFTCLALRYDLEQIS